MTCYDYSRCYHPHPHTLPTPSHPRMIPLKKQSLKKTPLKVLGSGAVKWGYWGCCGLRC